MYFDKGRATRIRITNPELDELYRHFTETERPLSFPFVRDISVSSLEIASDEEAAKLERRVIPGDLKTMPATATVDELRLLYTRLERLRRGTKTLNEEQGVHTLFLALGLLEWKEGPNAEEKIRSPLVLVPVELRKEEHQYKLYPHEDDVEDNPALTYRLQHDFNLILPRLSEFEPVERNTAQTEGLANIEDFLQAIAQKIRGAGWTVVREVWLAQFAFYKLAMYRDLEGSEVAERAAQHEVLPVLCGIGQPPRSAAISIEEADRHHAAPEGFPVLDADSSQLEVLERVRQGQSLVVQGPPGTGKSQTIVNIIAQALRRGQRVLFVSEKRAALEVVHKRLRQLGLDPPCLELHSHRANRKAVIEQLVDAARTAPRWGRVSNLETFEEYRAAKERLDRYVQELHRPYGIIHRTAFQIHGGLAKLEGAPRIFAPLPIPSVLEVRPEGERALREAVAELSATRMWDGAVTHPYRDVDPVDRRAWMPELVGRAASHLQKAAEELQEVLQILPQEVGIPRAQTAAAAALALHALEYLRARPILRIPAAWLRDTPESRERVRAMVAEAVDAQQIIAEARTLLQQANALALAHRLEAISPLLDTLPEVERQGFMARWRFALRSAHLLRKEGAQRVGWPKAFMVLRAARELRSGLKWYDDNKEKLAQALGPMYQGVNTACHTVLDTLRWISECPEDLGKPLSELLLLNLAEGRTSCSATALDSRLADLRAKIQRFEEAAAELTPLFAKGIEGRLLAETALDVLIARCERWALDMRRLPEWLAYRRALQRCEESGLKPFLDECREQKVTSAQLGLALERALLFLWKQEIYNQAPQLAEFDGQVHDAVVDRFCELDRRLKQEAVHSVLLAVAKRIPDPPPFAEHQRLQREAAKKGRHLPLRRLLPAIPNFLLAYKPCLLMSPLSVAVYLPKDDFQFDLVVFDEASQLPPADAIGAILRGKQVVILGDNKQLPPTDFFQAHAESDETEVDQAAPEEVTAFESILDIAAGALLPQARLLWHYRSIDERLIAFSNHWFYKRELITFPVPDLTGDHTGVRFIYVPNGIYARGGSRTNLGEAQRIVDLVLEHLSTQPDRSLGVITMNIEQRDLIENELRRRLQSHPDLAALIVEDQGEEPFFVKNLETVQGDERDEIIISVGYGPTEPGGPPTLQFGPLNRSGGERRWNVAITRARYRTTLVASMRSVDLDGVRQARWEGPRVMAEYTAYAERGGRMEATAQGTGEPESDFELAIRDALQHLRYDVDAQVGSSGFRIDLAVRHPDYPSRYILGIECDGAGYHSAKIARDRDRLRQAILQDRGWVLDRVWSTDWSVNPERALKRIVDKIETLRKSSTGGVYRDGANRPHSNARINDRTAQEDKGQVGHSSPSFEGEKHWSGPDPAERDARIRQAFSPYHPYHPRSSLRPPREFDSEDCYRFSRYFADLVQQEGPVHKDVAIERMLKLCNYDRLGHRIATFLEKSLSLTIRRREVEQRGDFLWPSGSRTITPRRPHLAEESRNPEQIAPEEWEAAVLVVLQVLGVSTPDDIVRGVVAGFDYDRVTAAARAQAEAALDRLVTGGRVVEKEQLCHLVSN